MDLDMTTVLISSPAIYALVNLARNAGLTGPALLALAMVLGTAVALSEWAWRTEPWFEIALAGLLIGGTAGAINDTAKTIRGEEPRRAAE